MRNQQKLNRCKICKGGGKLLGPGMLKITCEHCKGTGEDLKAKALEMAKEKVTADILLKKGKSNGQNTRTPVEVIRKKTSKKENSDKNG